MPVRIELTDTRNERAAAMAAYARYRDEKPTPIVMGIHQAADIDMLKARSAEDKIPEVCTSPTDLSLWPAGWQFQSLPAYSDQAGLFLQWLSKEWAKSGKESKCRVAFFHPDQAWGHSHTTPEVYEYAQALGNLEIVETKYWDWRSVDVSTDIKLVAANKPDWIYACVIGAQPKVVLSSAKAAGVYDKVHWAFSEWGAGPEVGRLAGKDTVEGIITQNSFPCWADDTSGMKIVKAEFQRSKRSEDDRTSVYPVFWVLNEMAHEAIKIVVNKWGWENLDGSHMYEAFKNMKDVNVMGMAPFTFAAGKCSPQQARMMQYKGGEPVPISDWLNCPDLRPAAYRNSEAGWAKTGWPGGWPK